MSFANGLKKGHYFLNFEDEKEKVIKPTYAKGVCVKDGIAEDRGTE